MNEIDLTNNNINNINTGNININNTNKINNNKITNDKIVNHNYKNNNYVNKKNNDNNFNNRPISAYQQLSGILNALKSEEISLNDAMNQIQLKDNKPTKPYCKVTSSGALALYGISKQPIVMYSDQWIKLLKITKSNYIENYIKYNHSKLKQKRSNLNSKFSNSPKSISSFSVNENEI
jgi:hypothetical protein